MTGSLAPLVRLALLVTIAAALVGLPGVAAARPIKVIVPDGDNLQYLSFWVAKGAGLFETEGLEIDVVVPEMPKKTPELVKRGDADVFVLPPPISFELIADHFPVIVVATLLEKDPINVVVRRSVLEERKLSPTLPLAERIAGLRGMTIGVAPGPPPRLRALVESAGMDAEKDIKVSILPGRMQNAAFGEGSVDALYAHTPYLEKAILDQDGVLLIHQSAGEVPALPARQIHALGVTRRLRETEPEIVLRLVRAIAKAQALVHASQARAVDATLAEFPTMDRRHVELLVRLYEPAIPAAPHVSVDGLRSALALYPASRPLPELATADLSMHVDESFAREVAPAKAAPARATRWPLVAAAAAFATLAGLGLFRGRTRRRQGNLQ